MSVQISRRSFLKTGAAGVAALVVGIDARGALAAGHQETVVNPFVRIDRDGTVTVIAKHFEMGQGTSTGLTTLVAEELDADWNHVKVEFAPADQDKYKNLFWGVQSTGGSTAIANSFMQYRKAGAAARELLVQAAAQKWGVGEEDIVVSNGILTAGSKQGHFGDFIAEAVKLTPSGEPELKSPDQFKLIGKLELPRKDSVSKTDGSAVFAMDVKLPGMVYAAILRSPRFGGTLTSFDAGSAQNVAGFIDAKALPNQAGVVAFAKNTWAALQARNALSAEWDFSKAESRSTSEMIDAHRELAASPEYNVRETGRDEAQSAIGKASKTIEAEFLFPFLAHAPMEPLNCVIEPTENGVRFHDGCQGPSTVQFVASHVLGLKPEQIEINTVYAGGSFGRRGTPTADYQVEAALAFALLGKKTPVKLVWSREDDIRGGYYRPMALHKAQIGLDDDGNILGWDHQIATKSITKGTPIESLTVKDGVDHLSVEGAEDTLYNLPNLAVGLSDFKSVMPTLWWRSVGHTHSGFVMESLIDMVAHETGKDPVELRLSLLDHGDARQKRMTGVIEAVRDLAGWKKGDKRGFAAHFSFNTWVAAVADVAVFGKRFHVNKLYIAVDCGIAVNPDVIRAQMEGGVGFALGAVMRNEITFKNGEVIQSNFPEYQPLRMTDMPEVEVTIVTSTESPSGVGEPGVPPTGPAVANAIFAQTGDRITELPMTRAGYQPV
ncbi:MAG: xanthine dehydrogenase family protein molybdopterin-binding subunit [Arenicellales bacterium]|nr:xanthine dehydrogenase family protein molybdopterin-binding subunit [Arenicellales bacterium]